MKNSKIKIVDIGHKHLKLEDAQSLLETTISQTLFEGDVKIIKIITGHGSGVLRKLLGNGSKDKRGAFKQLLMGEDYNMFNTVAADMRSECFIKNDNDFGKNNSGVTYVWLW